MLLPYLVPVSLVAMLVLLGSIAIDVKDVRRLLCAKPAMRVLRGHHVRGAIRAAAFSVWSYTESQWNLIENCGQEGCSCGPEPQRPGQFEGEVVRKECAFRGKP